MERAIDQVMPLDLTPPSPPLRRLHLDWEVPTGHTVVAFDLSPTATGTQLSVVHTGFAPGHAAADYSRYQ